MPGACGTSRAPPERLGSVQVEPDGRAVCQRCGFSASAPTPRRRPRSRARTWARAHYSSLVPSPPVKGQPAGPGAALRGKISGGNVTYVETTRTLNRLTSTYLLDIAASRRPVFPPPSATRTSWGALLMLFAVESQCGQLTAVLFCVQALAE